ncbi:MAG: metallopeptidase family protein [Oscillospiraceae bacterium]|nr:metallopeptidase family protein [Oscillospiraceae bacterium]
MYTIDDMHAMLDTIAAELPDAFWEKLHGGVIVLPDVKLHPGLPGVYIMGDYSCRRDYGRSIRMYHGSFVHVHGHLPPEQFQAQLRHTLLHEFTHHLESLAGERGLEIQDKLQLERYRRNHHP